MAVDPDARENLNLAAQFLKSLFDEVRSPDWATSLEAQLSTFRSLMLRGTPKGDVKLFNFINEDDRVRLYSEMAERLGWESKAGLPNYLRIADVTAMVKTTNGREVPDILSIRRALVSNPKKRLIVEPGAELLPSEGWLSDYLDYAHDNEAPISYHFFCGLTMLGLGMRRNVVFDRNAFELWPNNYVFLIGPTAGRKSQAIGMAKTLGKKHNQLLTSTMEKKMVGKPGYPKGTKTDPFYDYRPIYLPKECSPQKLLELLRVQLREEGSVFYTNDSVGLLANDEVATLIGKTVKFSDDMIARLTDLYSSEESAGRATLTYGEHQLRNICFSFIFGSAPSWIRTSVTTNMFQGGFLNRSIFVYRRYKGEIIPFPAVLDPITLSTLASALVPWTILSSPVSFYFPTGSAESKWFEEWYHYNHPMELEKRHQNGRLVNYLARKQDHLCRMAMLLQISASMGDAGVYERLGHVPIQLPYLEQADRILSFEEQFLPECFSWFGEMDEGDKLELVWAEILKLGDRYGWEFERGKLTKAMSAAGRGKDLTLKKQFLPFFEQLEDMGRIETFSKTGKRPWVRVLEKPTPAGEEGD